MKRPCSHFLRALAGPALALAPLWALPGEPQAAVGRLRTGAPITAGELAPRGAGAPQGDWSRAVFWSHAPFGDLQGADFSGRNLQRAYLGGTDCRQANFRGADLRTAALDGARLQNADFTGAKLLLQEAGRPHFRGVDLSGALWFKAAADLVPVPPPAAGGPEAKAPDQAMDLEPAVAGAAPVPAAPAPAMPGLAPAPPPAAAPEVALGAAEDSEAFAPQEGAQARNLERWKQVFQALQDYAREHDLGTMAKGTRGAGVDLHHWIWNQRRKKDRLSGAQRQDLESLPGWLWQVNAKSAAKANGLKWEDYLALLQAYSDREGDCDVPGKYVTENGIKLGRWAIRQRTHYNQKKKALTRKRIRALEAIQGWSWNRRDWRQPEGAALDPGADRAMSRKRKQPGPAPAADGSPAEAAAGARPEGPARKKAHLAGAAAAAGQAHAPAEIQPPAAVHPQAAAPADPAAVAGPAPAPAMPAEPPSAFPWQLLVQALEEYALEQGSPDPGPEYETEEGFPLGHWVLRQRERFHAQDPTLAQACVAALEGIPGWHW
jgi:hypothetical protein